MSGWAALTGADCAEGIRGLARVRHAGLSVAAGVADSAGCALVGGRLRPAGRALMAAAQFLYGCAADIEFAASGFSSREEWLGCLSARDAARSEGGPGMEVEARGDGG